VNKKQGSVLHRVLVFFFAFVLISLVIVSVVEQDKAPISKLGEYTGYSQPIYDEWLRVSQYITVRDGTKLAVDIFRPAQNGKPVNEPLPVIWTHDRYRRAHIQDSKPKTRLNIVTRLKRLLKNILMYEDDKLKTQLDENPWLQTVLKHGYVIGVVDVRGGGASYGTRQGPFTQEETWDAYDITEWFALQSWSNGRIGMYGDSYLGITQYMAASTIPPHLEAIFPEMAMFEMYSFCYPGGVFHNDFIADWSQYVKKLDTVKLAAPVDIDTDGTMQVKAILEHQANSYVLEMFAPLHYRDSRDEVTNNMPYVTQSPSSYLAGVKASNVAIYHLAGWYDMWPRDALVWFKNLDNPQKIIIGPWSHSQRTGLNLAAEHLRWYDYWLKGIDNGIMDEAPIHYYTMGAPKGKKWRSAWQWPLPNEKPTRYYFSKGTSESVNSVNDGLLSTQLPVSITGQDDYTVDYTTTSGTATRWTHGGAFDYLDMTLNDEKGLTYTTQPLVSDVEVTGHPIIHLWVTSTAKDGDFFVYLEEVDENGYSHYITEGTLRASHRATTKPPFDYIKLPYHRSFAEDVVNLPSEPVELVFDLHPTSNIFDVGHRIRATISGTDKDNALTPKLSPPPTVSIYRNTNYSSYIILPIILIDPKTSVL